MHGPSQNRGHTLDLLISRGLNISFIVIKDVALSDHFSIFFDILISVSTESRSVSVRKRCINCPLFSLWHSTEAVTFFLSPSSPLSSLLCSLVLRDSLCTALQTERLWIWSTGLPIQNHDNRYFADWIRLCPGLSKNSEDGNSCPKPHKAARLDYKGKLNILETKMDKMDRESSLKNLNALTRPKDKTVLYFSGLRLLLESTPGEQCSETLLLPPPPYRHYRHCPSPDHSPPFALNRQPVKRVWPVPD